MLCSSGPLGWQCHPHGNPTPLAPLCPSSMALLEGPAPKVLGRGIPACQNWIGGLTILNWKGTIPVPYQWEWQPWWSLNLLWHHFSLFLSNKAHSQLKSSMAPYYRIPRSLSAFFHAVLLNLSPFVSTGSVSTGIKPSVFLDPVEWLIKFLSCTHDLFIKW